MNALSSGAEFGAFAVPAEHEPMTINLHLGDTSDIDKPIAFSQQSD